MLQIKKAIVADEFKFTCALVMVDFFFRHGIITPDEGMLNSGCFSFLATSAA